MIPFDFFLFISWLMIMFSNICIALNKNKNFVLWFFISLITGPVASFIIIFLIEENKELDKNSDILKYIKKKTRFKLFNWNHYNELINMMNFKESELLKIKRYLITELGYGRVYLTYFTVLATFLTASAVWWIDSTLSFSSIYLFYVGLVMFIIGAIILRSMSIRIRIINVIKYKIETKNN